MGKLRLNQIIKIVIGLFQFSQSVFPQALIKVGNQVWMSQNLETTIFSNNDPIIQAQSMDAWETAFKKKQPAWCYYEIDSALAKNNQSNTTPIIAIPLGKLYNIYVIKDSRNVCPVGFRVPENSDWQVLIQQLDSIRKTSENDRIIDQRLLKSTFGWQPGESKLGGKIENSNGNNLTGFNAFPTGYRGPMGNFLNAGKNAVFWIKTGGPMKTTWCFNIPIDKSFKSWESFTCTSVKSGLAIRCIQDDSIYSTSN